MLSIVITYYIIQLIISITLWYGSSKTKTYTPLNNNVPTTVIIPFKNEVSRILPLIESINKSAIANKKNNLFTHLQFLFIDDHSTDKSIHKILNSLDISYQIIRLRNTSGKKHAIKKGVEKSIYDRILTLDADVNFDEKYLETILKTPCDGLTILSVNMDSKSILQRLFAVEFWFLQRLTFGLAGFNKYVLCNGANLLFTKETFNKSLEIRTDGSIASGDDIFLLKAVNQLKLPVNAIGHHTLSINTLPPLTLTELLNQRKRWIRKMNDIPSLLGGVFILCSNVFFIFSIYNIFLGELLFIIPIITKVLSETISVAGGNKKLTVLFHQLFYPIYLVLLPFSFLIKGKEWRT